MSDSRSIPVQRIAEAVGGSVRGPGDLMLTGVGGIDRAAAGQLTFITEPAYAERWATSQASAALLQRGVDLEPGDGRALIDVTNAELAMARALALFAPPLPLPEAGVHATAVVDRTAKLGDGVRIGPLCIVGAGAVLGEGVVLHGQVTVLAEAAIGDGTVLWPGAVVRERCRLGRRCMLHANVSIGADGFGYRPDPASGEWIKVPQIGIVDIGDDVELGASTCVDRAKFDATVIGAGTKIDNLVQIGHNCRIGRRVIIAGSCGIAGSVTIGDGTLLGGMVAIRDHITIGERVVLSGCSQVIDDVPAGETWAGSPAQPVRQAVRQHAALRKLPDLVKQMRRR